MFKLTVRNSTNIMLLSAVVLTLLFLVCYEFIIIKEHEYVNIFAILQNDYV